MKMSKKIKAAALFMTAFLVFVFAAESNRILYGSAKVKGSKSFGPDFEYDYLACVDIEVNSEGKIIQISDNKKNTEAAIDAGSLGHPEYNKPYWKKYLAGKGFEKYKNKTLEDVKKIDIGLPGNPGVDAVGGATAASLAVKNAVVKALVLDASIKKLENYKKSANYKKEEQKKLEKLIKEGKKLLESKETYEEIEKALAELKKKIDELNTK